jgi:hypothetical protein
MTAHPAAICRGLLAALEASEGRRQRRRRDTTPDAVGLGIKRALLERAVAENPAAEEFEAWLLEQCLVPSEPGGAGAVQAMAREILHEWRLAGTVGGFGRWLAKGAPSADRAKS